MSFYRFTLSRFRPGPFQRNILVPVMAAALGAAFLTSSLADAQESNVQSILQIEQIKPRIVSTQALVDKVVQVAKMDGLRDIEELEPLLEKAAASAFNSEAIEASVSSAVEKSSSTNTDPSTLTKAATEVAAAQQKITDANAAADARAGYAPSDKTDGQKIAVLIDAMASPELAAETAFTQQVMYVALEAMTNTTEAQLAAMPMQDLTRQMKGLVEQLRDRNSNEKPLPRDVAEALEKNRLTLVLASLPHQDLQVLYDFYTSDDGKEKRDALVSAYQEAFETANIKFLENYFQLLVEHIKSNPGRQQN